MYSIPDFVINNSKVAFTKPKVTKAASNYIRHLRHPKEKPQAEETAKETLNTDYDAMDFETDVNNVTFSEESHSPSLRYIFKTDVDNILSVLQL